MPADVMDSGPTNGPWDEYAVDPRREAEIRDRVIANARADGIARAVRGGRRKPPYMPDEFQREWLSGYDAARSHGERHASQARPSSSREQRTHAVPAKRHSA